MAVYLCDPASQLYDAWQAERRRADRADALSRAARDALRRRADAKRRPPAPTDVDDVASPIWGEEMAALWGMRWPSMSQAEALRLEAGLLAKTLEVLSACSRAKSPFVSRALADIAAKVEASAERLPGATSVLDVVGVDVGKLDRDAHGMPDFYAVLALTPGNRHPPYRGNVTCGPKLSLLPRVIVVAVTGNGADYRCDSEGTWRDLHLPCMWGLDKERLVQIRDAQVAYLRADAARQPDVQDDTIGCDATHTPDMSDIDDGASRGQGVVAVHAGGSFDASSARYRPLFPNDTPKWRTCANMRRLRTCEEVTP